MWGKLASEILVQNWSQAVEDIQALRDAIEARPTTPPLMLLQQRCWLMHWALFIFGNHAQTNPNPALYRALTLAPTPTPTLTLTLTLAPTPTLTLTLNPNPNPNLRACWAAACG